MSSNTWAAKHIFPTVSQAAAPAVEELLERLRAEQWNEHDIFSIHLALEEAISNAMEHGNGWDAAKEVELVMQYTPDVVRVEIADQGRGFDPAAVPDPRSEDRLEIPRGRGLLIMRSYMTNVHFLDAGRRLVLEKCRGANSHVA